MTALSFAPFDPASSESWWQAPKGSPEQLAHSAIVTWAQEHQDESRLLAGQHIPRAFSNLFLIVRDTIAGSDDAFRAALKAAILRSGES